MFDLNYILTMRDRLFRTERTVAELEERVISLETKLVIATEELVEWQDVKKRLKIDEEKKMVNNEGGKHYRRLEPQPWDVTHAWGLDFFLGNVIKYVARAGHKGDAIEDLEKAKHYLEKKLALLRIEQGPRDKTSGAALR